MYNSSDGYRHKTKCSLTSPKLFVLIHLELLQITISEATNELKGLKHEGVIQGDLFSDSWG